jgi:hypothetical protein
MRLLWSRGKLRVKGEDDVAEKVQKRKTAPIATTTETQLSDAMMVGREEWGLVQGTDWTVEAVVCLFVTRL